LEIKCFHHSLISGLNMYELFYLFLFFIIISFSWIALEIWERENLVQLLLQLFSFFLIKQFLKILVFFFFFFFFSIIFLFLFNRGHCLFKYWGGQLNYNQSKYVLCFIWQEGTYWRWNWGWICNWSFTCNVLSEKTEQYARIWINDFLLQSNYFSIFIISFYFHFFYLKLHNSDPLTTLEPRSYLIQCLKQSSEMKGWGEHVQTAWNNADPAITKQLSIWK